MLPDRISSYSGQISGYSTTERAPVADTAYPVARDSLTKHRHLQQIGAKSLATAEQMSKNLRLFEHLLCCSQRFVHDS